MVDYFRPPANKDTSGWHGPARVVKHLPELGQVLVNINGVDRPCRLQDVRLSLMLLSVLYNVLDEDLAAQKEIIKFISNLPENGTLTLGYTGCGKRIMPTSATHKHHDILKLLVKIASTCLGIRQLVAVRLSNNACILKPFWLASSSTIVYWKRSEPFDTMTYESAPGHLSLSKLAGQHWRGTQCIQFLHGSSSDLLLLVATFCSSASRCALCTAASQ